MNCKNKEDYKIRVRIKKKYKRKKLQVLLLQKLKQKWNVECEMSTEYFFFNLEKRHYTERIIKKVILDDNTEITDQEFILQQQKRFYENLYESRDAHISDNHIKTFSDLGETDSSVLESELTQKQVKLMKNSKSPGLDGFTIEFYIFF